MTRALLVGVITSGDTAGVVVPSTRAAPATSCTGAAGEAEATGPRATPSTLAAATTRHAAVSMGRRRGRLGEYPVCVFVLSSFRTGTGSAAERRPCATEHVSFFSTRRQWGGGVSESRRVAEQPEARRGHALQYGCRSRRRAARVVQASVPPYFH